MAGISGVIWSGDMTKGEGGRTMPSARLARKSFGAPNRRIYEAVL